MTLPEGSVSDLPAELPLPAAFALSQKQYRYERLSDWETGKKKKMLLIQCGFYKKSLSVNA